MTAWHGVAPSARAATADAKPRVAVMDFTSPGAPADFAALGSGLQSMITTDLAQVSTLTVVERARLQEIEKELRLSHSKAVDPSTAARLGKLAGTTHLVVGTFQVAGKQMRLDGRLVEGANGKVTLATSAEGEKDAFFELEKTLVSKLIAAMDVKVTAKERGEVARIHTTDFEAFRQYAIGVRLSDDAKYQEAIAAMRTALKKDEEFRLARVAISEYERLAAELRARADAITANEVDQHRTKLQGEFADKRQIVDKLFAIARDTDAKARFRRAAATYMLSCAYGSYATGQLDYWGLEDSFANRRMRESLATRYYADALVLWPKVHLHVHCLSQIGPDKPRALDSFDREFKEISERMRPDLKHLLRTRPAHRLAAAHARKPGQDAPRAAGLRAEHTLAQARGRLARGPNPLHERPLGAPASLRRRHRGQWSTRGLLCRASRGEPATRIRESDGRPGPLRPRLLVLSRGRAEGLRPLREAPRGASPVSHRTPQAVRRVHLGRTLTRVGGGTERMDRPTGRSPADR